MNNIAKTIGLILSVAVTCFAALQFDTRGMYTWSDKMYNNMESYSFLEQDLTDKFSIIIRHQLNGAVLKPLMEQRTLPTANFSAAELEYRQLGTFNLGFSNDYFGYQRTITPPYILPTKKIYPVMMNTGDMRWNMEISRFGLEIDATYYSLDYKLQPKNPLTDTVGTTQERDADLWGTGRFTYEMPKGFFVSVQSILKNDLNEYSKGSYHIDDHLLELGGTHLINRKKFLLNWSVGERFRKSKMMYLKEYQEGFATELDGRLVWKIKPRNYIKPKFRS